MSIKPPWKNDDQYLLFLLRLLLGIPVNLKLRLNNKLLCGYYIFENLFFFFKSLKREFTTAFSQVIASIVLRNVTYNVRVEGLCKCLTPGQKPTHQQEESSQTESNTSRRL